MGTLQKENSDRIIAQLRPRAMWDAVASSDKQFLLIGDSDHRNPEIMARVAPVISTLAFDGFKHLALEWRPVPYQGIINAFNNASQAKRADLSDLTEMDNQFALHPVPMVSNDAKVAEAFRYCNDALLFTARLNRVGLIALNDIESFTEVMPHEPPAHQVRYLDAYAHYYMHGKLPSHLSPQDASKVTHYANTYMAYNLELDESRARRFKSAVGNDRAGIMFGSAHFRGDDQDGIDAFLPPDQQAYVLIGDSMAIQMQRANLKGHAYRNPDFILMTDTGNAYVTATARKNGLWHG